MGKDLALPATVLLVVDDDPAVRNSLQFSLELEGYRVRAYGTAGELLNGPDLPSAGCLIIDYVMPDMTGLELLAKLRSRNISLPALLITTHPSALLRKRAAEAGVEIIEKPLLGNALLDAIACALTAKADSARGAP